MPGSHRVGKDGPKLPTVVIKGRPVMLKTYTVEAGRVKVPVMAWDSRDVVAWAYLPQADFDKLRRSPVRPDYLAWRMDVDGRPTTRLKGDPTGIKTQVVTALLAALGRDPAVLMMVLEAAS